MPVLPSVDQVRALGPDDASFSAGRKCTDVRNWSNLGLSDDAAWGEFAGSGSKPYQVRVDLGAGDLATKCSCPSRKFPCKHAIGLMLVLAGGSVTAAEAPLWVTEWVAGRREKAEAKVAKAAEAKPVDPEKKAATLAKREESVAEGVELLERWLCDGVRGGLAGLQGRPGAYWEDMARRMVDHKAPGLGGWVRGLGATAFSGEGWHERLLFSMGRLYLLLRAFQRLESLAPGLAADVRSAVGIPMAKEEVLAAAPVEDAWLGLALASEEGDDGIVTRRCWLRGVRTGRYAVVLDFYHRRAGASPVMPFAPGELREARLCFYPSAWPRRALVMDFAATAQPGGDAGTDGLACIDNARAAYATALAANPWSLNEPVTFRGLSTRGEDGTLILSDERGSEVRVPMANEVLWPFICRTVGRTIPVFGEWTPGGFSLMSYCGPKGWKGFAP